MSHQITLITNKDYFSELVEAIDRTKRGNRIALATMAFHPNDPVIDHLIERLVAAARRGATVTFCFDAFALMFDDNDIIGGPLSPRGLRKKSLPYFEHMAFTIEQLEAAGVTVGITNIPKKSLHIPYGGRSHIKGAVVGSQWWIGGCNFSSSNTIDCMVSANDQQTADYIYDLFCGFARHGSIRASLGLQDVTRSLSDETKLLVDVGVRDQSVIYDEALRLIDTSQEWIVFTSQAFPSGKTAKHLAQAVARGVHVRLIVNGPDKKLTGGFARRVYQHFSHKGLPKSLFDDELDASHPYLHAKILATEQGMIIGSHNMVSQGVALGTAEIAIISTDISLVTDAAKMALQLAEATI